MIDFASAPAALTRPVPLDPTKHVRYTLGMVLGVDDFDQEFTYLSGRDRWLARDLSGYGTVWGLRLAVEVEASGPRVNVAPGAAVTPCGQLVCVSPAQCASLNDWLAANVEEVRALLDEPRVPVSESDSESDSAPRGRRRRRAPTDPILDLHVVLCYRECPTDDVPIPGEPCRTEQTLTEPSRLKDDFRLELRTVAPQQPEEDAIRDFVAWLRRVPVVDGEGSTLDELLAAIRAAADDALEELGSPPDSPPDVPLDMLLGAPDASLRIPAAHVGEFLRAAFRIWVTELRPALRHALPGCDGGCVGACGCGCDGSTGTHGEPCGDDVVLLGTIALPVVTTAEGTIVAGEGGWVVDESRRPYVLHTRFLQEWLLQSALVEQGAPPEQPPPISDVTVTEGPLAVAWDATTRVLDLRIPKGAAGEPGPPGAGIEKVSVVALEPGSQPTAKFEDGILTLGIPLGGGQPAAGAAFVVVAGRFSQNVDGLWNTEWQALRQISVRPVSIGAGGYFFVQFDDFSPKALYMVKGTPIVAFKTTDARDGGARHTFELLRSDDALRKALITAKEPENLLDQGLVIRTVSPVGTTKPPVPPGFALEISEYENLGKVRR